MEEIKAYKLAELSQKEKLNPRTIKNRTTNYIPIRIGSKRLQTRAKNGEQKKDYTIKYIRLEDIKKALKGKVEINFIS